MAVEIKVPSVGESITEGTLVRWLKKDGDVVRVDEPLYELETEKATGEVPAPATGRLRILVPEGQTVPIGSPVGRIEEGAAAPAVPEQKAQRAEAGKPPKPVAAPPPDRDQAASRAADQSDRTARAGTEAVLSPGARRLAEEQGIDVRDLAGTGRGGRITKEDVLAYLEERRAQPQPAAAPAEPSIEREAKTEERRPAAELGAAVAEARPPAAAGAPRENRQRMSAIRARIAERLVASKNTAAILTTFNEADMTAVMALRAKYKDTFREKHGVTLGFMSFFVKASIEGLHAFPIVNARIDGSDIVYHNYYDIGVAVSTDKGLMVPVLRAADRLGFAQIEKQLAEMAQKARDGKITVNDLQGGTFTITNGGVFGSLLSTPILNPPQSGILGMHAIQKRPVAVADQVVIRPMMYLALSYDHRLIDGREAVQFLVRVKECIESPERLMLEV